MDDFCAPNTSAQVNAAAAPLIKMMNSRRLMVILPFGRIVTFRAIEWQRCYAHAHGQLWV